MNYAIFTYREDAECLEICINQVRKVDQQAVFYIFDDGRAAIHPDRIPAGADVHYKRTWFNRGGNLNGQDCICGMLASMQEIPGDAPVVKLDSDTLLLDTDRFIKQHEDGFLAGGVECFAAFAFSGICYWLSKKAINDLLTLFCDRTLPDVRNPEDVTISNALFYLYGGARVALLSAVTDKTYLGINHTDDARLRFTADLARGATAIHCGQVHNYADLITDDRTPRQAAAEVMRRMLTYLTAPAVTTFN